MTDYDYYQATAIEAIEKYKFITADQMVRYINMKNRISKNSGLPNMRTVNKSSLFHALEAMKKTSVYEYDDPCFKIVKYSPAAFCSFDTMKLKKRLAAITVMLDIADNTDIFDDFPTDKAPCELVFRSREGLLYEIYTIIGSERELENARVLLYHRDLLNLKDFNTRKVIVTDEEMVLPDLKKMFPQAYLFAVMNSFEDIVYKEGDDVDG